MDDAAALQGDADLVPLPPPADGLRRRLRVVHVLGHVGVLPEQRLRGPRRSITISSLKAADAVEVEQRPCGIIGSIEP